MLLLILFMMSNIIYFIITLNYLIFFKTFNNSGALNYSDVYFLIHGCPNALFADNLFSGSFVNNFIIKSFASFETLFHYDYSKYILPYSIFFIISSSVSPSKGGDPHNKIYNTIPDDQISHFSSYFSSSSSGAI